MVGDNVIYGTLDGFSWSRRESTCFMSCERWREWQEWVDWTRVKLDRNCKDCLGIEPGILSRNLVKTRMGCTRVRHGLADWWTGSGFEP